MTDSDSNCPVCECLLPADAPQGLCPRCLLQQGLAHGNLISGHSVGSAPLASAPSCLQSDLAAKIGSMPVVLLGSAELGADDPASRRPSTARSNRSAEAGRYTLYDEIARGGMGAILRGRDQNLGRELAIKVLLEHHLNRPDLVRRFIEEAQIGGQLQHPGIVPVHELGMFEDDRPYFTMKLVRGRTLTALLEARENLGDERPRFLAIFEHVCQTIAYAHSRGVIHRDLKPGNVMVGSFGEVQVMDWGLAKLLKSDGAGDSDRPRRNAEDDVKPIAHGDDVGVSRSGLVLGTPAYMAPEQARGETDEVDERADVFGLGAILCEILTGRPPYVGRTTDEIHHLAVTADLVDAHARLQTCGAEPEPVSLALRCLAPLPRNRPRDAGAVAVEITAYLRGVQERLKQAELARVEAQARSAQEKTRRRLAVGLAATIVVLMATLGGGWSWRESERQRRATRVDLALSDVKVLKSEAESVAAGDDPARWASAVEAARRAAQVLDDARDDPTRESVATIVRQVEEGAARADADRRFLARLSEIGDGLNEDPTNENEAAYAMAFREARLDVDNGPTEDLRRAIARRPPQVVVAIAAALDQWTVLRLQTGDQDRAARLVAITREIDPDDWRGRLRAAVLNSGKGTQVTALKELAESTALPDLPARTLALLGAALLRVGDFQLAEAVLRPAQRQHPNDLGLALCLGRALFGLSRNAEGVRYYMVARAIRPQTEHALAHALWQIDEKDEAIAVFREGIRTRPTKARNYACLGKVLKKQGLAAAADEVLDAGIVVAREEVESRPDDPFAMLVLGHILNERGQVDGAADQYRQVIRLLPSYAFAHNGLGLIRQSLGRIDEGIAELREATRLEPHNPQFHRDLAESLVTSGKLAEAIDALAGTIRLVPDAADLRFALAEHLERSCRFDEAIDQYHQTIRLTPHDPVAHFALGRLLRRRGPIDEAIAECREAIRLKPDFAEAYIVLAVLLKRRGEYLESLRYYERCHELGSTRGNWTYPSAKWVAAARRLVRLEPRAAALLSGDATPADATEYLDLAVIARNRRMFSTAATLWTKAFAIDPKLVIDTTLSSRYAAAAAAAMAGCGKGIDEPALDDAAKARRRSQALNWLKAELAAHSESATDSPKNGHEVELMLLSWRADIELTGVRDKAGLADLPEAERNEWQAFWLEVDRILTNLRAHSYEH
jgi:eukaryotic-like serine/threonine-protein kinase